MCCPTFLHDLLVGCIIYTLSLSPPLSLPLSLSLSLSPSRDESVYDYVYSTGMPDSTTSSHSHQTSISSDNTSSSYSNCDTPENSLPTAGSANHLPNLTRHTHSLTMPNLSSDRAGRAAATSKSVELLSTQPPKSPSPPAQARHSSVLYAPGSTPQVLELGGANGSDRSTNVTRSQPILDVTPPPPPPIVARLELDRRRSNSMGRLESSPRLSAQPSSESVDRLNAEPYLRPMEIQMVMHTLPRTQKLPESTSFHSIHGGEAQSPRRQQHPVRVSAVDISEHYRASVGETGRKFGHRRTASNPRVLESGGGDHHLLGDSLPPLPPPVPARDYPQPSLSPPLLSARALDPDESSLDFPHDNRRSVVSASLSPKPSSATADQPQPHYADIDEIDNVSTVSGPFEEISDDPDSTAEGTNEQDTPEKSQTRLVKKTSSTLNSDYEKIEEYITMAPLSTFPRRSIVNPEMSLKPTASGERTPKKATVVPPPKTKKGWTRQSIDSVIPDTATIRSSSPPLFPTRRFTMMEEMTSPNRASSSSVRPLPPSPAKPVTSSPTKKTSASRNLSSASNIYETIDEELLNRVHPRRRGSGLPKWAPPVEPKHYAQYMVILRKFFTDPKIIEAWGRTVQEIIPGGDLSKYPPPYSNVQTKQTRRLGPMVEVATANRAGSAEPSSSSTPNHVRESSHDQYVLPTSLTPPQSQTQSRSMPATPAVPRPGGLVIRGGVSSPRELFASKRPASRENLIEMLNMTMFNQGDSSESESDESEDEETEEEEEEEEEEESEGESEGGEGVGESEGVGEEGERELSTEGEILQTAESDEERDDEEGEMSTVGQTVSETVNSSHVSPDKATEDDLDSILASFNPILSIPDSTTAEPTNPTSHEISNTKSDSQTHIPPDPIHMEHNPVLRASVSTDSDIDSTSSLVKPSALFQKRAPPAGGSRVMKWVSSFEQETQDGDAAREKVRRGLPPVPKRKPTRNSEVVAADGMSDSGISNCHSQTFDDGFNPLETS